MQDYGSSIHTHLKKIESDINLNEFLGKHSISKDYRAKMVDWMVEVLTTFKTSD
jgi:cyclin B/cyclin A